MVAGSVAGMVEHIAMYPVDTIKTRMQALSHPGQRVGACVDRMRVIARSLVHAWFQREGQPACYVHVGACMHWQALSHRARGGLSWAPLSMTWVTMP